MHNPERLATSDNYREELRAITSRQLDARTIDTYADDALNDLITLTQKVIAQHSYDPSLTGLENERQALMVVGLDPDTVEHTLDHIDDVAASTKRLDTLIQRRTRFLDMIIVPPDSDDTRKMAPGDGAFEKPKEFVPKLKTLLLLLEKSLDIDIENDDEVKISTGAVPSTMMRSASYNIVEIASLSRIVLTCDEIGNATYIFDTEECGSRGITPEFLGARTKKELNDLADDETRVGRRLVFSKQYAERISAALVESLTLSDTPEDKEGASLLAPTEILDHIPPGYATITTLAEELDMTAQRVHRLVRSFGKEIFGKTERYKPPKHTGSPLILLSQGQQEMLRSRVCIDIPEGYMTFHALSKEFGVDPTTIGKWANAARDELGDILIIDQVKRGTPNRFLSPQQQEFLRSSFLTHSERIEGYMTLDETARYLKTTRVVIKSRLKEAADAIGEIRRLRRGKALLLYLSPDQVQVLAQVHSEKKIISHIPPGYATAADICNNLGISRSRLNTIIYGGPGVGPVLRFHEGKKVIPPQLIFSLEQQILIAERNELKVRRVGRAVIAAAGPEENQPS